MPRSSKSSEKSLDSGPSLIYIEKLNKDVNEGHLKEIFSVYGTVLRAFYPKSNRKYTIRRFGLVEFEKKS